MQHTFTLQNKRIRTDWIHKIERGNEHGMLTCTIWFSVGPVGVCTFKGEDAKTALEILAKHPAVV